jgi:transposase-like protein
MRQEEGSGPNRTRARWQLLVTAQAQSSLSVRAFCEQHQVHANSFYAWRKALGAAAKPVRFALVETTAQTSPTPEPIAPLELLLCSGHRLRIAAGVDAAILQTVLQALLARA